MTRVEGARLEVLFCTYPAEPCRLRCTCGSDTPCMPSDWWPPRHSCLPTHTRTSCAASLSPYAGRSPADDRKYQLQPCIINTWWRKCDVTRTLQPSHVMAPKWKPEEGAWHTLQGIDLKSTRRWRLSSRPVRVGRRNRIKNNCATLHTASIMYGTLATLYLG